ncbi:hypothetical protein A2810_00560 [candidate division Kazan bacterium RIFCSPHIGHO2_01_FULL_49_10]|uniref:PRC-barrel domain-containing protein n=1 Tax=candidate division Kazan bacterium RIFCSPLOWO2_01_FULL_48_13 TaxID=1798539 RepID=A0A1F4PPS2_UNCK3|nr:MAG: hypothetical protein A2810_00560 [candidate division Kazan bacterium RIFCSPHIGHO2_01_FULL_49_10]OGB85052.1 MAG: hypothetical protein A2994_00350 [candidate division Kazan bacterium RIFCSPLOWO2_01_FULL_48_13]
MLKAISEVVGSRLVDLDKSQTIGEVVNWVVNPDDRRLSAVVVRVAGLFGKTMVVTTTDIIEYGPRMVVVKNQLSVVAPEEVAGMPKLLRSKFRLIGGRVETKSGRSLGQIEDIMFETTDSSLQKFYVKPSLLGLATRPDVIIGIDKVVRIEPRRIIVNDETGEPIAPAQTVTARV